MNSNRDYATENINLKKRLETLESNSDKVIKDSVKLINKNLELQARLETLEKENQELKETIEIRKQMNINLIDFGTKLKQENEKLKKTLEILKNKLVVEIKCSSYGDSYYLDYSDYCFVDNNLTQQEYELINEVLGND